MDSLSNRYHPERSTHATHGIESRSAIRAQGFVQRFPSDPRCLSNLRHPASTGNVSQRRCQQSRVVGLQNVGQISSYGDFTIQDSVLRRTRADRPP